ncbi:hypothetical protein [Pedobacter duraquae]|uniref:hypothetical protein n=1 Tax=Pedobacter duraquae TaxID=425511 RepID=UPI0014152B79|nr:hypothetical protein [Pedobacter duraquae]
MQLTWSTGASLKKPSGTKRKNWKLKSNEGDFAIISYFSVDEKYRSMGVGK